MKDRTVLITGASSGIGFESALGLAKLDAEIVMVGRDEGRTAQAAEQVRTQTGNSSVSYLLADLSSLKDVRRVAQEFKDQYKRLDVLLNNAGAVFLSRKVSVDGYEMTLALNHLNYFLLTNLLLDLLRAGPAGRVVNVASRAHYRGHVNFDDLQSEHGYNGMRVYGMSKLMNVLFNYELARRLQGTNVTANCLHPGFVASNFAGNNGWFVRFAMRFMAGRISVEDGAKCSIYLASSADVDHVSGKYFNYDLKETRSSEESYDEAVAKRLWDVSEKLVARSH
ncbi:MAG TPA: SDR family oxidoreductase [Anaerolineales bacterium]|nr:SDR family oxidoreductase [Anaerolineales bacterium]